MDDTARIDTIIEESWSNYCDLDYWVERMTRSEQEIPKHVLKMAMKHLRDSFKKNSRLSQFLTS